MVIALSWIKKKVVSGPVRLQNFGKTCGIRALEFRGVVGDWLVSLFCCLRQLATQRKKKIRESFAFCSYLKALGH